MHSRAQVSAEFIIFIGMAFLIAIAFEISSLNQINDFRARRESEIIRDLTLKLQKEILIAANVEDGYSRIFEVPQNAEGINFSIETLNSTLTLESKNSIYTVKIPFSYGNLTKGTNAINKTGGVIHIN